MGRDRAAYMREYRKRNRVEAEKSEAAWVAVGVDYITRIEELEEEVRHLKAELAKRPAGIYHGAVVLKSDLTEDAHRYNTRPFTPVPKRRG